MSRNHPSKRATGDEALCISGLSYLPALDSSSKEYKKASGKVSLPRGNGETILVVDDEASILTITRQTLQAFGYRVLTATDGAEAVAVYSEKRESSPPS